jgi:hypothetical protein
MNMPEGLTWLLPTPGLECMECGVNGFWVGNYLLSHVEGCGIFGQVGDTRNTKQNWGFLQLNYYFSESKLKLSSFPQLKKRLLFK